MEEVLVSFSGSKIPTSVTKEEFEKLVHGEGELKAVVTLFPNGFNARPSHDDTPAIVDYKIKVITVEFVS